MRRLSFSSAALVGVSLAVTLLIAACGGAGSSATAIPTFTQIPTYNFVQPTPIAAVETAVATKVVEMSAEATSEATAESIALDPELVTRGKGRYDALQCASCHSANGEGTDKGSSLITYTANEGDFIAFMRSGGKVGTSHQYATNRLSETGGSALYQYLVSLRKSS